MLSLELIIYIGFIWGNVLTISCGLSSATPKSPDKQNYKDYIP